MTDAEKMETKTLDLITEMEKKIMDHEREKREWEERQTGMMEIIESLTNRLKEKEGEEEEQEKEKEKEKGGEEEEEKPVGVVEGDRGEVVVAVVGESDEEVVGSERDTGTEESAVTDPGVASESGVECGVPAGVTLASLSEEKRVLIAEAEAYQKERDQLTAMISHKHRECLDYYQQLTNLMTAFQTVYVVANDIGGRVVLFEY